MKFEYLVMGLDLPEYSGGDIWVADRFKKAEDAYKKMETLAGKSKDNNVSYFVSLVKASCPDSENKQE